MATSEELGQTADVLGDHIEQETQYGESYRATTEELASRLSLPVMEVGEVMESMAGDPAVPVAKDGEKWQIGE